MDESIDQKITELRNAFERNRNPTDAKSMEAYMKNKFIMYGAKSALRRSLSKPFIEYCKSFPLSFKVDIARKLHGYPEREMHHIAQELLEKGYKKSAQENDIHWIAEFITTNSWWDTVDFIAPKIAGTYFQKFPQNRDKTIAMWLESGNLWLVRSAILFQLKYKDKTDWDFLQSTILKSVGTKEFFINKAIGWVLRENSRRIPEKIISFVKENEDVLSELSKKEALRLLK